MAAPMFDFTSARKTLQDGVESSLKSNSSIKLLQQRFSTTDGSDGEKKATLDQAMRDILYKRITKEAPVEDFTKLINLATVAVTHGMSVFQVSELCTASTPFVMLSDLFDSNTLDKCSDIFAFVEERVDTWKSDTFHTAGKNYLLRMCNDLLRRLSKSQDTLFCGRIQLFLARLFPLTEKSGLNLTSQFNLENVTYYNTKPEEYKISRKQSVDSEKDESMEVEDGEMDERSTSIRIDYNLYRKFWSLQDYFRKPSQCYEKVPWKTFINYADEVLTCFDSFKLDNVTTSRRKFRDAQPSHSSHTYFAKYLTSEKLLDLQLSDSTFRRYVLVQFLTQFQYLNATVKFKNAQQVLSDDQTAWVKKTQEKVYELLRETPPDGDKFAAKIEHLLSREENWNSWKNDSCPSFIREKIEPATKSLGSRKRTLGDDMKLSGAKLTKMGNGELTRLWNLCPDNMEACRTDARACLPTLENYFEEAAEQLDPESMVDDEYKLINDKNWSWKALRLLARRSSTFFAQSTPAGKTLPQFLSSAIEKLAKENPALAPTAHDGDVRGDMAGDEDLNEMPNAEENIDRAEEQAAEEVPETVTRDQMQKLATELASEWTKLATELNYGDDEIEYIKSSETASDTEQALRLLNLFLEQEPDRATPATLRTALREIGLAHIATNVFGNETT